MSLKVTAATTTNTLCSPDGHTCTAPRTSLIQPPHSPAPVRSAALKKLAPNPAQMSLFDIAVEPVCADPVPATPLLAPVLSPVTAVAAPLLPEPALPKFDAPTPLLTQSAQTQPLLAQAPIAYILKRVKRKSIGFMIDDAGLTISAPRWVSRNEIDAAVVERHAWIRTKLEQWAERKRKLSLTQIQWRHGDELPYLGSSVFLSLGQTAAPGQAAQHATGIVGQYTLCVNVAPGASTAQIRDTVQSWLQAQAKEIFTQRLKLFENKCFRPVTQWQLTSARSIWGRAHADGTVRLNWRLIHFSLDVIDYVIAHELAHLKEMNHSPRFWAEVGRLLPGFEAARDRLKGVDPESLPLFT